MCDRCEAWQALLQSVGARCPTDPTKEWVDGETGIESAIGDVQKQRQADVSRAAQFGVKQRQGPESMLCSGHLEVTGDVCRNVFREESQRQSG